MKGKVPVELFRSFKIYVHRALNNQNLEINSLTSEGMLAFLCIWVSYFMHFIVLCAMRKYVFCFVKICTK